MVWGFVLQLALYLASLYIQYRAAKKAAGVSGLGAASEQEVPDADATRAIPVAFGTCKISNPNVIWYRSGGASTYYVNSQPMGYEYHVLVDLGLCLGPLDAAPKLLFDDKDPGAALTGSDPTHGVSYYALNSPNLFGGTQGNGGVTGQLQAYWGFANQPVDSWIASGQGLPDYPGYAGLAHAVAIVGGWHSETVPAVAAIVLRTPNTLGLTGNHHRIDISGGAGTAFDANPACMLFELLTDTTWGVGLDTALIDITSFRAVGDTLFAEGFGLSMLLDSPMQATDAIREILRHIDGGLSTDPESGLLILRLVRADYVIDSLPVLDESSISSVEFSRGSWSETINVARVNFLSYVDNFTPRVAQWQNLANQQALGVSTVEQFDYRGLSNAKTANLVAARLMKVGSYPFAKIKFKANRMAWALRQCDVFVLNWAALGISGMVCRVTRPAGGTLEDGELRIEAVEDAFAIDATAYTQPDPSQWTDPSSNPPTIIAEMLWEPPLQLSWYQSDVQVAGDVWALAVAPSSGLVGFDIWSDPAGGTSYSKTGESSAWTPRGTLVSAYAASTAYVDGSGFAVQNLSDIAAIEGGQQIPFSNVTFLGLMIIDNEILGFTGISGSGASRTLTGVWRGLFDTVPADHAAGAAVWFVLNNRQRARLNPTGYHGDESVTAKLLSKSASAVQLIAGASQIAITQTQRQFKPLPPGDVRVGVVSWPTSLAHGSDVSVGWKRRDRNTLMAYSICAGQGDGDYTDPQVMWAPVVRIEVRVSGTLQRTVNSLTTSPWAWTSAMQATDCGGTYNKSVSIRVIPVSWDGTYVGTYQERTFTIT